jgi:opacity protein-like surface antigen
MKFTIAAAAVAASLINYAAAADLDPIVIKGNKFFYKTNGTQLYVDLC